MLKKDPGLNFKNSPLIFLFILFLLLVGFITGIVTHTQTMSASSAAPIIQNRADSLILPFLISVLKNLLIVASGVLCAIWIPGIILTCTTLLLDGFIIGFTLCAFMRYSFFTGLLFSSVCVILPTGALLYGFILILTNSLYEWRLRLRSYFCDRVIRKISVDYWLTIKSGFLAVLLGIFIEGVLSPLIIRLFQ